MNKTFRNILLACFVLAGMGLGSTPLGARAAGDGAGPVAAPAAPLFIECETYSTHPWGGIYHVGGGFSFGSIFTNLVSFVPAGSDMLRIENTGMAGGSGNEARLRNITARMLFDPPTKRMTLYFGEFGGNINVRVNGGILINKPNLDALNGLVINGVTITVVNGHGADRGRILATGPINSFSIGGQVLWIDNVCRY